MLNSYKFNQYRNTISNKNTYSPMSNNLFKLSFTYVQEFNKGLVWYLSPGDAGLPTRCCSCIILERRRSLFSAASSCSAVNIGTGLLRLTCRLEAGDMIFETDLNIFGVVVNGDKTSRADGMLLKQNFRN